MKYFVCNPNLLLQTSNDFDLFSVPSTLSSSTITRSLWFCWDSVFALNRITTLKSTQILSGKLRLILSRKFNSTRLALSPATSHSYYFELKNWDNWWLLPLSLSSGICNLMSGYMNRTGGILVGDIFFNDSLLFIV